MNNKMHTDKERTFLENNVLLEAGCCNYQHQNMKNICQNTF